MKWWQRKTPVEAICEAAVATRPMTGIERHAIEQAKIMQAAIDAASVEAHRKLVAELQPQIDALEAEVREKSQQLHALRCRLNPQYMWANQAQWQLNAAYGLSGLSALLGYGAGNIGGGFTRG